MLGNEMSIWINKNYLREGERGNFFLYIIDTHLRGQFFFIFLNYFQLEIYEIEVILQRRRISYFSDPMRSHIFDYFNKSAWSLSTMCQVNK